MTNAPGDAARRLPDAAGIAALLPHRGAMSLLERVVDVDATRIECLTDTHRRRPHPMADAVGRLGIACAIEIGAQAMALHAALTRPPGDTGRLPAGMLAGVRTLRADVARLDDVAETLTVVAELLSGDARTALYALTVRAADRPLLSARATVVIDASGHHPLARAAT